MKDSSNTQRYFDITCTQPIHTIATFDSTVKSVPSRKSSIQPGDRVMEINGINYTEFKTAATANDLLDTVIIYVLGETEVDSGEEGTSYEGRSQSESYGY